MARAGRAASRVLYDAEAFEKTRGVFEPTNALHLGQSNPVPPKHMPLGLPNEPGGFANKPSGFGTNEQGFFGNKPPGFGPNPPSYFLPKATSRLHRRFLYLEIAKSVGWFTQIWAKSFLFVCGAGGLAPC